MELQAGIAEMVFSRDPADRLVARGLGSCVGVALFDPAISLGGMLHVLLPHAGEKEEAGAAANPLRYADTGLAAFFKAAFEAGAKKERLVLCAAGGAAVTGHGGEDFFQVGSRNVVSLRKALWHAGVVLKGSDFGGNDARTLWLDIAGGRMLVRRRGVITQLAGDSVPPTLVLPGFPAEPAGSDDSGAPK
jgi:chemotaxis protein CheD